MVLSSADGDVCPRLTWRGLGQIYKFWSHQHKDVIEVDVYG